jgi:hypothetical protein
VAPSPLPSFRRFRFSLASHPNTTDPIIIVVSLFRGFSNGRRRRNEPRSIIDCPKASGEYPNLT